MKKHETYICDYCGQDDFQSEAECLAHETFCRANPANNLYSVCLYIVHARANGALSHEKVRGTISIRWTHCLDYHYVFLPDKDSQTPSSPKILLWHDPKEHVGRVLTTGVCNGFDHALYLEEEDDVSAWVAIRNHVMTQYDLEASVLIDKRDAFRTYVDGVIAHIPDEEPPEDPETP